jgi:tetratricopeptide (TPR) repeat protein
MKSRKITYGVFIMAAFMACIINTEVFAQELSKAELEQRALTSFEKGQYDKAAIDYKTLHNMFPKDTKYAYYFGRSILGANKSLPLAIDLLKFVATRNYGDDTYFYLGLAYLLNYEFDDASLAFTTFMKTANNRELEEHNADYWLTVCSNARQSATVARALYVENLQVVPENAIEIAFKENIDGRYVYIPEEFKSESDIGSDYQTLMFIPKSLSNGDYLYFDSQTKKGKQGTDIYRVRRITPENYSLPEALSPVINTSYDDAYPYYDKATNTLYFSSKGHSTSGGFDIFKSEYDSVNSAWKTPEKLDFPINTPYDDYLYTVTADRNSAIFLTNRNSGIHEAEAFTIQTSAPPRFISPENHDDLLTCALLAPSSIEINAGDSDQNTVQVAIPKRPESTTLSSIAPRPADEYARLIREGLDYESKSDSLDQNVRMMQTKAEKETDLRVKQDLVANLTTLDQESKRFQRLADEKFLQAERVRGANKTSEVKQETALLKPETTQQGITRYSYQRDPTSQPVTSKSNEKYEKGLSAAKSVNTELSFIFAIQTSSPYSAENPIPVAILPDGLIYRIQLGAFTNPIPDNAFGGLSPVSKEKGKNETKYYVGYFTSVAKAREALEEVRKYGYPDAFIVSFFDSKKISIQKAREIEFAQK